MLKIKPIFIALIAVLLMGCQQEETIKTIEEVRNPIEIALDSPKIQAKQFVSAYLSENDNVMQQITSKKMIAKLHTIDDKVKSYFKTIESYQEMIYFHDLKALVIGKSQGQEIKFNFSWNGKRWIMDRVL